MKRFSIRLKITLWFTIFMIIIAGITMFSVLVISGSVIRKGIKDDLIGIVETNATEVELLKEKPEAAGSRTVYIPYEEGYIEINSGFLNIINGVYTALYDKSGELIYGDDPTALRINELPFIQGRTRTVEINGTDYYVYDFFLQGEDVGHLRLRGAVSTQNGTGRVNEVAVFSLWMIPMLVVIAATAGFFLAGYFLRPIRSISDTAEKIRVGGDLKSRINLGKGDDEVHRLANTFDNMFDRLERSFAAEQQFTSDVSHELRTPVSVICSQCEYTLERERTAEEYTEALEVVGRQGKKMSNMINEILSFARMEQNPEGVKKEEFNLSRLVKTVCDDLSLIKDKNITLRTQIEEDIKIFGNAELITRLITNLVTNAYRYGKENGEIFVTLNKNEAFAEIKVKDNGIGICEDKIDKIWDRFYQADSSRSGKGSGLGLCMVKQIALIHGGSCEVESKENEGSIFTVLMKL